MSGRNLFLKKVLLIPSLLSLSGLLIACGTYPPALETVVASAIITGTPDQVAPLAAFPASVTPTPTPMETLTASAAPGLQALEAVVTPTITQAIVEETSKKIITIPTSSASPMRMRWVERNECPTQRCIYDVSLRENEAIVGAAYDFQDKGENCIAFLIRGPGQWKFSVLDGAWDRYSGVIDETQIQRVLQSRVRYLNRQHWFCRYVRFPIVTLRSQGEMINYQEPLSTIQLLEVVKTGVGQRETYDVNIEANEVIIGNAWDFQDQGYNCVVFVIHGQGPTRFSITDGAWYRYSVSSQNQVDEILQGFVNYLKTEHDYCRHVDFPILRLQAAGMESDTSSPLSMPCYGKCWRYDDNARTMTWIGPNDGLEDIWQAEGEPLTKIRAGYTAIFEITIPMQMEICIGSVDGKVVSQQCKPQVIDLAPGTHMVTSPGPQGGFRVSPDASSLIGLSKASNLGEYPAGVVLSPSEEFSPTGKWIWICTGDLSIKRADGTIVNLFDEVENTGLITVFAPNNRVKVFAPYGAYCEAFSPKVKNIAIALKISTMLTSSIQCENGCSSVNVKEVDSDGSVINDYWQP